MRWFGQEVQNLEDDAVQTWCEIWVAASWVWSGPTTMCHTKAWGRSHPSCFFGWIYEPLTEVALLLSAPVEPSDLDQPFSCSGWIYKPPTEAALLPPAAVEPSDVDDYRVVLSLSLARKLGVESIQQTQQKL